MPSAERPSFADMIRPQWASRKYLCIGLDADVSRLPASLRPDDDIAIRLLAFNERIIEATCDLACAYKLNSAYYEAIGSDGIYALAKTIEYINRWAPQVPVIIDGKRGDIGSTNRAYASFLYDQMGADAATVHPYFGGEALEPILARREKHAFVIVRTSNPGAGEFQDLTVDGMPLYLHVAKAVATKWNYNGNCGLVVGATYPAELRRVRDLVPADVPILIPGVGSQGGDLASSVRAASVHGASFLISVSRAIIFSSNGQDFDQAARDKAIQLNAAINDLTSANSQGGGKFIKETSE
jgi:orotidine-5'-phosphate decarboxylase